MTTKEFNEMKEQIKQYSEYYRVSNRKYKDNTTLYIFYKFYFSNGYLFTITVIHEWGSYVMFVKSIRIKSLNKGE